MYSCFKLGFYSRLGIPDNQEIPSLEPMIKAAYEKLSEVNPDVLGHALENSPGAPLPVTDPNLRESITHGAAQNPRVQAQADGLKFKLPSSTAPLMGTPLGVPTPELAQKASDIGGMAMLPTYVAGSLFPNTAGRVIRNPLFQGTLNSAYHADTSAKLSAMLGEHFNLNPNGGAQTALNVTTPVLTGVASTVTGGIGGTVGRFGGNTVRRLAGRALVGAAAPRWLRRSIPTIAEGAGFFAGVDSPRIINQAFTNKFPTQSEWNTAMRNDTTGRAFGSEFLKQYVKGDESARKTLLDNFYTTDPKIQNYYLEMFDSSPQLKSYAEVIRSARPNQPSGPTVGPLGPIGQPNFTPATPNMGALQSPNLQSTVNPNNPR